MKASGKQPGRYHNNLCTEMPLYYSLLINVCDFLCHGTFSLGAATVAWASFTVFMLSGGFFWVFTYLNCTDTEEALAYSHEHIKFVGSIQTSLDKRCFWFRMLFTLLCVPLVTASVFDVCMCSRYKERRHW